MSLAKKEIIPFLTWFLLLLISTIILDFVLHMMDLVVVGRYLGPIGTFLIVSSFVYSLRKRKWLKKGNPKKLLQFHEYASWGGALLILVHAGIHINAILPWIAIAGLVIAFMSGLIGEILLKRSRTFVEAQKESLKLNGLEDDEIETQLFWNITSVNLMKNWKTVHLPITLLFAVLSFLHIISIMVF